ncbi:Spartin [Choanephora cucurbitarum]|uniref:Spartin n=1 Tax=Choanephora cucurbitarum TaxID=101091 RepID=A0A1C7NPV7_9FUNG|nr:Spartin [Choanephora cucurbitarum]
MTVIPITPTPEELEKKPMSHLCLVDKVALYSYHDNQLSHMCDGHLIAYITSDPEMEQQAILLRFFDLQNRQTETIVLVSTSKAWLQGGHTLIFPKSQGGLWKVDFSKSTSSLFDELQDILTYFMKYENRHQMKNTLAMVNPVSCEVTQVVASDVELERSKLESMLNEDDFITTQEAKQRQKLPVYVDTTTPKEPVNPHDIRKVKLLYHSSNAMVTGSDWIAQAILFGGQALSQSITNGSKRIQDKIEPNANPVQLSDRDRKAFEVFYNTTHKASQVAAGLVDMAVTTALSGMNNLVQKDRQLQSEQPLQNASKHFGISALQAAVKVVGGVASAASMVIGTTSNSLVGMIDKKYGPDAGFMAAKTLGSGVRIAETLVYFDGRGISRRVVMSGIDKMGSSDNKQTEHEKEVIFESNWTESSTLKK